MVCLQVFLVPFKFIQHLNSYHYPIIHISKISKYPHQQIPPYCQPQHLSLSSGCLYDKLFLEESQPKFTYFFSQDFVKSENKKNEKSMAFSSPSTSNKKTVCFFFFPIFDVFLLLLKYFSVFEVFIFIFIFTIFDSLAFSVMHFSNFLEM